MLFGRICKAVLGKIMSPTLYLWIFAVNKINCLNFSRNFWCKAKILDIFKMFITKSLLIFTLFIFRTLYTMVKYKQFLAFFYHWTQHIWISLGTKSHILSFIRQFCLFGPNLPIRRFSIQNRKSEYYHRTQYIRISSRCQISS